MAVFIFFVSFSLLAGLKITLFIIFGQGYQFFYWTKIILNDLHKVTLIAFFKVFVTTILSIDTLVVSTSLSISLFKSEPQCKGTSSSSSGWPVSGSTISLISFCSLLVNKYFHLAFLQSLTLEWEHSQLAIPSSSLSFALEVYLGLTLIVATLLVSFYLDWC